MKGWILMLREMITKRLEKGLARRGGRLLLRKARGETCRDEGSQVDLLFLKRSAIKVFYVILNIKIGE